MSLIKLSFKNFYYLLSVKKVFVKKINQINLNHRFQRLKWLHFNVLCNIIYVKSDQMHMLSYF